MAMVSTTDTLALSHTALRYFVIPTKKKDKTPIEQVVLFNLFVSEEALWSAHIMNKISDNNLQYELYHSYFLTSNTKHIHHT